MRFFLLTDDDDTATGMRLAGIEGEVFSDGESACDRFDELSKDGEIGIILMNSSLMACCKDTVAQFRKSHTVPIVIEIPDKNSNTQSSEISDYVRQAIGIKI